MKMEIIISYILLVINIILIIQIRKLFRYNLLSKINKTASYCRGSEKISIKTNTKNNRKKKK